MSTFETQFQSLGYRYDAITKTGYAMLDCFPIMVKIDEPALEYIVTVSCKLSDPSQTQLLTQYMMKYAADRPERVKFASFNGTMMSAKMYMDTSGNITEGVREAADVIMYYAKAFNCVPYCPKCSRTVSTGVYSINGRTLVLCNECLQREKTYETSVKRDMGPKKIRYGLGILGAFLGTIPSIIIYLLLYSMGWLSSIAPIFCCMGAYLGFRLLGKRVDTLGLFLSICAGILSMGLTIYLGLGFTICDAFRIYYDMEITLSEAFSSLPLLMQDQTMSNAVWHDVFKSVIPYIVGTIGCIMYHKRMSEI